MKKLILLLTLVAVSFSADKWEYLVVEYQETNVKYGNEYYNTENFRVEQVMADTIVATKYDGHRGGKTIDDRGYVLLNGLKLLGEDGWELVNVVQHRDVAKIGDYKSFQNLYFKRKIN